MRARSVQRISSVTQETSPGFFVGHDTTFDQIALSLDQRGFVIHGEGLVIRRGIAQGPERLQEPESHLQLVFWQRVDQGVEAFSFPHDEFILPKNPGKDNTGDG